MHKQIENDAFLEIFLS